MCYILINKTNGGDWVTGQAIVNCRQLRRSSSTNGLPVIEMMMACTPSFICFLLCTKANSDKQKILLSDSSELISGPAEFHRSINLNGTMTPTDKNSAPEECEDAQLRHLDTINYNYLTLVGVLLPNIPLLNWSTRSLIGTTRPQEALCRWNGVHEDSNWPNWTFPSSRQFASDPISPQQI